MHLSAIDGEMASGIPCVASLNTGLMDLINEKIVYRSNARKLQSVMRLRRLAGGTQI